MKKCNRCGISKPLTAFHRRGSGYRSDCKKCRGKAGHFKRKRKIDPFYTVYFLPKENYIGMTNAFHNRLGEHRHKYNRDTSGHEVVGRFNDPAIAHIVETFFHWIGFDGFHYKAKTKKSKR